MLKLTRIALLGLACLLTASCTENSTKVDVAKPVLAVAQAKTGGPVDLDNDTNNCGAPGNACPRGARCAAGTCACQPPLRAVGCNEDLCGCEAM